MDKSELKIENLDLRPAGMSATVSRNDIRVTHVNSGLVVEIPHGFARAQHRNIEIAMTMFNSVLHNDRLHGREGSEE